MLLGRPSKDETLTISYAYKGTYDDLVGKVTTTRPTTAMVSAQYACTGRPVRCTCG